MIESILCCEIVVDLILLRMSEHCSNFSVPHGLPFDAIK